MHQFITVDLQLSITIQGNLSNPSQLPRIIEKIRRNDSALIEKIEYIDKIIESSTGTIHEDINDLFKQLLEGIKEKPNHIGEIINAGWQYKCDQFYPKMKKLFFIENNDINNWYEYFQKEMTSLDDKLKKSIEISYIHNLFSEE